MPVNYYLQPYRLYCAMVSLKLVLSALICFGIIGYFGLDNGYLFMIPMFFAPLSLPLRIHQTLWETVLGNFIGACIFIPLMMLSDHFLIYTLLNLFFLTLALLIGFKSRFFFASLFVLVTGGVLYSLAITGPVAAASYGIEWVRDGFFGALVFFVIDFLICPYFALGQLEKILKNTPIRLMPIEECQKLFQVSKFRVLSGKIKNQKEWEILEAKIGIANATQFYQKRAEDVLEKLRKLGPESEFIYLKLEKIYRDNFFYIFIENGLRDLKNKNNFWEEIFVDLESFLNVNLNSSQTGSYQSLRLAYSFRMHLDNLVNVLSVPKERKIPEPPPLSMAINSPVKMAFLVATTLCSVVCFISFLALPGGMQPVFSAFAATMQPNMGKLSKQLLDRFLGVVFGGAASVLILLALGQVTHFWVLLFLFAVSVGPFIYLSLSRPQWAYIFLQAAITVLMLVAYDTLVLVPTIEVVGQRFFGISVGFIIGFTVMALFGLESASKIYLQKFHSYLSRAGQIIFKTKPLVPQNYMELVNLMAELKVLLSHAEFEFGSSKQASSLFKKQFYILEHIGYNLETLLALRMHEDRMDFKTAWLIEEIKNLFLNIEKVLKTWPDLKNLEILNFNLSEIDQRFQQELKNNNLKNLTQEERMHCFALQTNLQCLVFELKEVKVG